jgi:hypothetical protein
MRKFLLLIIYIFFLNSLVAAQSDTIVYNQQVSDLIAEVSDNNIDDFIQNLSHANGFFSRVSYTPGNEWAAHYIKQTFDSLPGLTDVYFDTFFVFSAPSPYDTIPLVNVVAVLEGSRFPSQEYIIGGHFDATADRDSAYNWENDWPTAIAPGADDNATGIACILEIARILSDSLNGFDNDYTIKFVAFGAEERHPAYNNENHWGSRSYVLQAFSAGDDIKGAYILDMIGFNDTGNNHYNIVSDLSSQHMGRKMLQVNQTYQIDLHTNSEPFPQATYSDHDQFWAYGYEAILVIENAPPWNNNPPWYNANPYYHKQTDTPDKVNILQVGKIAQNALGVLAHLSGNITGIEEENGFENIPQVFSLFQNYPNPFNPATTIKYHLAKSGVTILKIHNIVGEEIRTLINENQFAGEYTVTWNGIDNYGNMVTSGVYILTLRSGEFQKSQRMILLR